MLTSPALLGALLILELLFRFALPASNPPHAYFDPDDQIFRFDVNGPKTGSHTIGTLAQVRARWHINNMGWISEIDYIPEGRTKPLVAIIGDSLIVALQVDTEDSMPSLVRKGVGDRFDVYSFGVSGAPLIQYDYMSRYVNRVFNPDILVFNLADNDFDESLCDVRRNLGMICLRDEGGQIRDAEIIPYTASRVRRWARKSSMVRYLFLNLNLASHFDRSPEPTQNPPEDATTNRVAIPLQDRMERATEFVFQRIAEENAGRTVIIMLDGPRRAIYTENPGGADEFTLWLHALLRKTTSRHGFQFINLTEQFARRFQQDRVKFEWEQDHHWNARGHAVAAEALLQALQALNAGGR